MRVASAIDTLATPSGLDPECPPLATKVADWTVDNMQPADGYFYYRDLGWTRVKTPMLHSGQGTMVKALSVLIAKLAARI